MSGTVLLIQSDQAKRKRVHDHLEPHGHIVIDGAFGAMTHDLAVTTRPDLVLVDADMNGVMPETILREMGADERTANVPIVIANSSRLAELLTQVELNLQVKRLQTEAAGSHETADPLTGLYSAGQMRSELDHFGAVARRYKQALSVVLVGLDRFEKTNQVHGRQAGDEVLCDVGQRLASDIRDSDIVGRWDADEFMVILPCTPKDGARFFAERIRQTLAESHHMLDNGSAVSVTASFGCSQLEDGNMIEAAESALKLAKRNGRNAVYTS